MGIKQDETVSDTKARAGKGCQLSVTHLLLGIRSERSLMCLDLCSFDDLVLELYDSGLLHSKLVRKLGAAGSSWEQLGATGSNWEQLGVDGTHWCRSAVVGPGGGSSSPAPSLSPTHLRKFPFKFALGKPVLSPLGEEGFPSRPPSTAADPRCRGEAGGEGRGAPELAPYAAAAA